MKKKNIIIKKDILYDIIVYIYTGAFFGGKLLYLFCDSSTISELFSLSFLYGGFSLLGASFFGCQALLWFMYKNRTKSIFDAFLPISLILLHAFGRIGCLMSECCGGLVYGVSLHYVSIALYFLAACLGFFCYYQHKIISFYAGIYYYAFVIFFERFFFDCYRYDVILLSFVVTKYQLISLLYICMMVFFIYLFNKKN